MSASGTAQRGQKELALGEGYFVQYYAPQFGTYDVRHERLHPEDKAEKPHYALTETQYFGFYVPEKKLHSFNWVWYHPNLNSVLAGSMTWYGVQPITLGCELFDYRNHMSGDVFGGKWPDAAFDSGLKIQMLEPGKTFELQYDDPERGNHFKVLQKGVSEPVMWPSSKHFEQVMHCTGEVTLRGDTHKVDCYAMRDRSWGEYRLENSMHIPPNSWVTACFGPDFSFHVTGMDDPERDPVWKGEFKVDPESLLRFGWMIVDGEQVPIASAKIKTDYDFSILHPTGISIHITDVKGRTYLAEGKVLASTPFYAWLNLRALICMVEWTCNGRKGYGEIQTLHFTDFVRKMAGRK